MSVHTVLHGNRQSPRDVSGELVNLPFNTLVHIAGYIPRDKARGMTQTSRTMNAAVRDARRPFKFTGSPAEMAGYASHNPDGHPHVTWDLTTNEFSTWNSGDLPMVSELIYRPALGYEFLPTILLHLPKLRVLTILAYSWPQGGPIGRTPSLPHLKTLNLINCANIQDPYVTNLIKAIPTLETLCIDVNYDGKRVNPKEIALYDPNDIQDFLLNAFPYLPNLRNLIANNIQWESAIPPISLPNLETLEIKDGYRLGLDSLFNLLNNSPKLKSLVYISGLTDDIFAGIPGIVTDHMNYQQLHTATIVVAGPYRESLLLSLHDILGSMPNINTLHIGSDDYLRVDTDTWNTDDSLRTSLSLVPKLTSLKLGMWDITGIGRTGLGTLPALHKLETLVLDDCVMGSTTSMRSIIAATPNVTKFECTSGSFIEWYDVVGEDMMENPLFMADHVFDVVTRWKYLADLTLTTVEISNQLVYNLNTFVKETNPFQLVRLSLINEGPLRIMDAASGFISVFTPTLKDLSIHDVDVPNLPSFSVIRSLAIKPVVGAALPSIGKLFNANPGLSRLWIAKSDYFAEYTINELLKQYNVAYTRLFISDTKPW